MITRSTTRSLLGLTRSSPWTCSTCTRSPPRILQSHTSRQQQRPLHASPRRSEYCVPPLAHAESFTSYGVPGLLSAEGYKMAWTQYQDLLIQKLNQLTAGQPIADKEPRELALIFARDPMNAALFNHASMAFNNHFFFDSMSPEPSPLEHTPQLAESLVKTFGSIETLRTTMIDTADAMFGPGFVWLIWAKELNTGATSRTGHWRILTTYHAGSPFPEAGYRQQGLDMSNHNPNSYESYLAQQSQIPSNTAGAFGPYSSQGKEAAKMPPGGTTVMPVLCVNTWQHVWLYNYGIYGKRQYLEDWWNAVDWVIVQERAPPSAKNAGLEFKQRSSSSY